LGVLYSVGGKKQRIGGTPTAKIGTFLNAVWVLNYGSTNMEPAEKHKPLLSLKR
jgi:hypothetical protein